MPHIIVKLYAGRSEELKAQIAAAVANALKETAGSTDASLSVAIEDVAREDWAEKVYAPDIQANWDKLYKKPGYTP